MDVERTTKIVNTLIRNNHETLKYRDNDGYDLGALFHKNIQDAVQKVIVNKLNILSDEILEIREEEIKEHLSFDLADDICKHIIIDESSKLTDEALAIYFIDNIYEPLLSEGKELSKFFDKPLII